MFPKYVKNLNTLGYKVTYKIIHVAFKAHHVDRDTTETALEEHSSENLFQTSIDCEHS